MGHVAVGGKHLFFQPEKRGHDDDVLWWSNTHGVAATTKPNGESRRINIFKVVRLLYSLVPIGAGTDNSPILSRMRSSAPPTSSFQQLHEVGLGARRKKENPGERLSGKGSCSRGQCLRAPPVLQPSACPGCSVENLIPCFKPVPQVLASGSWSAISSRVLLRTGPSRKPCMQGPVLLPLLRRCGPACPANNPQWPGRGRAGLQRPLLLAGLVFKFVCSPTTPSIVPLHLAEKRWYLLGVAALRARMVASSKRVCILKALTAAGRNAGRGRQGVEVLIRPRRICSLRLPAKCLAPAQFWGVRVFRTGLRLAGCAWLGSWESDPIQRRWT